MLTRTMLHPAKRMSFELDALEGEHQVETTTIYSLKQLQLLLRKPGKTGNGKAPSPLGKMPGSPQCHALNVPPVSRSGISTQRERSYSFPDTRNG